MAEEALKFLIPLPPSLEHWYYRHGVRRCGYVVLGSKGFEHRLHSRWHVPVSVHWVNECALSLDPQHFPVFLSSQSSVLATHEPAPGAPLPPSALLQVLSCL